MCRIHYFHPTRWAYARTLSRSPEPLRYIIQIRDAPSRIWVMYDVNLSKIVFGNVGTVLWGPCQALSALYQLPHWLRGSSTFARFTYNLMLGPSSNWLVSYNVSAWEKRRSSDRSRRRLHDNSGNNGRNPSVQRHAFIGLFAYLPVRKAWSEPSYTKLRWSALTKRPRSFGRDQPSVPVPESGWKLGRAKVEGVPNCRVIKQRKKAKAKNTQRTIYHVKKGEVYKVKGADYSFLLNAILSPCRYATSITTNNWVGKSSDMI